MIEALSNKDDEIKDNKKLLGLVDLPTTSTIQVQIPLKSIVVITLKLSFEKNENKLKRIMGSGCWCG